MKQAYRYETRPSEYGPSYAHLLKYFITKETPCGFWISPFTSGKSRWVSNTGRKRFAHRSKKEALESFMARKNREIEILNVRLRKANQSLIDAQTIYDTLSEDGE